MQASVVPVAPASQTTTVATIGTTTPLPQVAVGLDWSVLIPLIFTGLGVLVTTITGAILSYRNGTKADAIHVLVNSGMTKALADLATAQEEIRTLRELVTALNVRVVGDTSVTELQRQMALSDIAVSQAKSDASKLPSTEVLAAQQSTPARTP